jgi:hypothetical protein
LPHLPVTVFGLGDMRNRSACLASNQRKIVMAEKQVKWWQWAIPIVLLLGIWVSPVPEGLTVQAWHMFAIFVATIIGILCAPIASGALMFIALAVTIFTNTLSFSAALSGFRYGLDDFLGLRTVSGLC